jgi:hypothetical protein
MRDRLRRSNTVTRQDSSLRGWSWIPQTASWVEPTAYSLILLNEVPPTDLTSPLQERQRLGEAMLYDRMCPGGGWNNGNPVVYGVAGEPRVGPTAWALLALKANSERTENQQSLDWLERTYSRIPGAASTALAHLCLSTCGRTLPRLEDRLVSQYSDHGFLPSTMVAAWVLTALNR